MSVINSISPATTTSVSVGTQLPAKPKAPAQPVESTAGPVTPEVDNAAESERLQEMIDRANKQLAGAGNQRVSFGYEERLNRLYVQIKDNATGEVVREIPPRKLIEQQAAMSEMIGIILDRNV